MAPASGRPRESAMACTRPQESIEWPRDHVRDARPLTPSPRVPSGRLRPSSTGYGEGRDEGAFRRVRLRPFASNNLRHDRAEFLVRHQPLFRRSLRFDLLENAGVILCRGTKTEFIELDLELG